MELCQLNALWCPEAQHTCTFVWPSQTLPRALHPQKFKQCLRTQMPTLLLWWFRNERPLIYFRFFRLPSRLRTLQFEGSRMRFDLKPSISWPAAIWNGASSILYGMNANQSHEDLSAPFFEQPPMKHRSASSWFWNAARDQAEHFLLHSTFSACRSLTSLTIAEVLSQNYPSDLRTTSRSSLTLGGGKKANQAKCTSYTCEWHAGRELETHKL